MLEIHRCLLKLTTSWKLAPVKIMWAAIFHFPDVRSSTFKKKSKIVWHSKTCKFKVEIALLRCVSRQTVDKGQQRPALVLIVCSSEPKESLCILFEVVKCIQFRILTWFLFACHLLSSLWIDFVAYEMVKKISNLWGRNRLANTRNPQLKLIFIGWRRSIVFIAENL